MAVQFAGSLFLLLLVITSVFAIGMANKNRQPQGGYCLCPCGDKNATQGPRTIVVGGPEKWHFGFNYSDWALKNGPFHVNDTLVFNYDPPNSTQPFRHSVYLLSDWGSYLNCNLTGATRIADVADGAGDGFKFVLTAKHWPNHSGYLFACGEHDGAHCNIGNMKFAVWPMPHHW